MKRVLINQRRSGSKEFEDKYANTFYLPVWLMVKDDKEKGVLIMR